MENLDIETILQKIGIDYKVTTSGFRSSCPNPNHGDSTPSWYIEKQPPYRHHCFGCGYRGNLYTLAKDFGINLPRDKTTHDEWGSVFPTYQRVDDMPDWTPEIKIKGNLVKPYMIGEVMAYLKNKRGIDSRFIERYDIKYAEPGCRINELDFSYRICIPVIDNGILWSVEGRAYRDNALKVLFPRHSRMDTLFDIDNLDRNGVLYVTEGIMDLVPLFYAGITNLTCIFGAGISRRQRNLLNEFKEIVFIPDSDEAGRNSIETMNEFRKKPWKIGILPEGKKDLGECSVIEAERTIIESLSYPMYIAKEKGIAYKVPTFWT